MPKPRSIEKPIRKASPKAYLACSTLFREDPETQQEMIEWLAQLIADRAIERLRARQQAERLAVQPATQPERLQRHNH